MERALVYELIDGEREYQDRKWPPASHQHRTAAFLTYMWHYYRLMELAETTLAYESDQHRLARKAIRKLASLAVACMEINGCCPMGSDWCWEDRPAEGVSRAFVYMCIDSEMDGTDNRFSETGHYVAALRQCLNEADRLCVLAVNRAMALGLACLMTETITRCDHCGKPGAIAVRYSHTLDSDGNGGTESNYKTKDLCAELANHWLNEMLETRHCNVKPSAEVRFSDWAARQNWTPQKVVMA